MPQDEETSEHTHLLSPRVAELSSRRRSSHQPIELGEASSIISSHVSKEEQELAGTAVGERLPYNDYTTIDWLHDLVRPLRVLIRNLMLTVTSDQRLVSTSSYPF
jgi:chloride channel 3/4/5